MYHLESTPRRKVWWQLAELVVMVVADRIAAELLINNFDPISILRRNTRSRGTNGVIS
jgi:hypothetical protein